MRNFLLQIGCLALFSLTGCSKPEDQTTHIQVRGSGVATSREVVDAGQYFNDVPSYEGRKVTLYLDRVYAPSSDSSDQNFVDTSDPKSSSKFGQLTFSSSALKSWRSMRLDPEREYTVTFDVLATDVTGGKKVIFDIVVEDFKVNYDSGARYGRQSAPRPLGSDGLPVGEIKLPVPTTVKDPRHLELFPEQYKGKLVRISRVILKERVTPVDEKHLLLDSEGNLQFLVKKELIEPSFSTWSTVTAIEVIGKVVTVGAQTHVIGEEITLLQ